MSRPQFDQAHHGGRHPGVQAGVQALVGHAAIQTTSDLTGLPLNEVLDELLSGKSLAQIAEEHAQSGDAIVEAVVAKAQERLDNAVESGRMTRERADEMLERLTERITDLVNDEELGAQVAQRLDRMVQASLVRATAQVTDLAPFDIIQQVQQDNTSLADVITEAGYTVQEVLDTAETVVEARLNVAVATERMTRAEADALLTLYSERAAQLINE
jgi:polyhydroxyalkanoate synthesis regulator phasin